MDKYGTAVHPSYRSYFIVSPRISIQLDPHVLPSVEVLSRHAHIYTAQGRYTLASQSPPIAQLVPEVAICILEVSQQRHAARLACLQAQCLRMLAAVLDKW